MSKAHADENGKRWLVNSDGESITDERGERIPAMHSEKLSKPGEFVHYDSSQGHCGLCGRLTCTGSCFK